MPPIRDLAYLTALAIVGMLWYADRSSLADALANARDGRDVALKRVEETELELRARRSK